MDKKYYENGDMNKYYYKNNEKLLFVDEMNMIDINLETI